MNFEIICADNREALRYIDKESVDCCVTSPPYFGLRNYGDPAQIGLEPTVELYIQELVQVFRLVREVLKPDGTLWLNLGDSYAGSWSGNSRRPEGGSQRTGTPGFQSGAETSYPARGGYVPEGLKAKDLIGIPWRVAFALQADGWWLRQDIIWAKRNPMPESVRDRCTRAHEYLFLLSKSDRYHFDYEAIKEPALTAHEARWDTGKNGLHTGVTTEGSNRRFGSDPTKRMRRSVWSITSKPYKGAHFATFPPALVEPCVLAGSRPGGTVLDPFAGAGTTGIVATQHGRNFLGVELNPEYKELALIRFADARSQINGQGRLF